MFARQSTPLGTTPKALDNDNNVLLSSTHANYILGHYAKCDSIELVCQCDIISVIVYVDQHVILNRIYVNKHIQKILVILLNVLMLKSAIAVPHFLVKLELTHAYIQR